MSEKHGNMILRRAIVVIIYLFPIISAFILTKRVDYVCFITAVMIALLGIGMKFFPQVIGFKSKTQKEYIITLSLAGLTILFTLILF